MTTDPEAILPTTGRPRLDYLDSLRGIAALMVVWLHYVRLHGDFGTAINLSQRWIDFGKIGVVLFFAISGFIIPQSLFGTRGEKPARRFIIGRFFRLYPAYWISVVLVILALPATEQPGLRAILFNVTMIQGYFGVADINGVAWTLLIELTFYAICLGLFLMGKLASIRVQLAACIGLTAFAVLLAAVRYYLDRKLPVALPLGLAVMFLGCLWRNHVLTPSAATTRAAWAGVAALGIAILPICLLAYSRDYGFDEVWYSYFIAYTSALTGFLLLTTKLRISSRFLVHLGTISYSIYLLHTPVYMFADKLGIGLNPDWAPSVKLAWIAAAYVAVLLVSQASYVMIEKPAIRLGRMIVHRGAGPNRAATNMRA